MVIYEEGEYTIRIDCIRPTESLIPSDKLEEIAKHYDGGSIESIESITGYMHNDQFYPDNGNKRALFLHLKEHKKVLAYIQENDPDEIADLVELAGKASRNGVNCIADLEHKIVNRDTYEIMIRDN
jgi:hypothetical protein